MATPTGTAGCISRLPSTRSHRHHPGHHGSGGQQARQRGAPRRGARCGSAAPGIRLLLSLVGALVAGVPRFPRLDAMTSYGDRVDA